MPLLVLAITSSGCSPHAEVILRQPFAPLSQQELRLEGRRAFRATRSQETAYLLEFQRPASSDGPPDFHLYVTAPNVDGELEVAADEPGGARGFLIQEVGLLRGKTELVSGTIRTGRVAMRRDLRRLELDVRCEDGTSITGKALVASAETKLRKFERLHAADVAKLAPTASPDGEPGESTSPRGVRSR